MSAPVWSVEAAKPSSSIETNFPVNDTLQNVLSVQINQSTQLAKLNNWSTPNNDNLILNY